jgi:hypothetical protein
MGVSEQVGWPQMQQLPFQQAHHHHSTHAQQSSQELHNASPLWEPQLLSPEAYHTEVGVNYSSKHILYICTVSW